MRWIPSAFCLRQKNRLKASIALREERMLYVVLAGFGPPLYVSFAIVDGIATSSLAKGLLYALIRFCSSSLAFILPLLLRGRIPHNCRFFLVPVLYILPIEYIMIREGLEFTPYFVGIGLVIFVISSFWPRTAIKTAWIYSSLTLPLILNFIFQIHWSPVKSLIGVVMAIGMLAVTIITSGRTRHIVLEEISASLRLASDLRNRETEVRTKAAELEKRRRFESQFSPQIVNELLLDMHRYDRLTHQKISVLVCDVSNSTQKATELAPVAYSEVIEEVFDIISAACLKWNITIDKFTGDGAQAFAGSPRQSADDFSRAIKCAAEISSLIRNRRDYLEIRWNGPLHLRISVCEGSALVGFLGRGTMKSFTAIGPTVSLSHRICSKCPDDRVLIYSDEPKDLRAEVDPSLFRMKPNLIQNLKGFEAKKFEGLELSPIVLEKTISNSDYGRCSICATPMILTETKVGIPKLECPACLMNEEQSKSRAILKS